MSFYFEPLILTHSLREICPNPEFFLVCIFLYSGKYGPEKTPYLDTFHAVTGRRCPGRR